MRQIMEIYWKLNLLEMLQLFWVGDILFELSVLDGFDVLLDLLLELFGILFRGWCSEN